MARPDKFTDWKTRHNGKGRPIGPPLGVVPRGGERLHSGCGGVVIQDAGDGVDEDGFAISTRAINEGKDLLSRIASEAVPAQALQEGDQLRVVSRGLKQERKPPGAIDSVGRPDSRQLGDHVAGVGLPKQSVPEVDCAVWCANQ